MTGFHINKQWPYWQPERERERDRWGGRAMGCSLYCCCSIRLRSLSTRCLYAGSSASLSTSPSLRLPSTASTCNHP